MVGKLLFCWKKLMDNLRNLPDLFQSFNLSFNKSMEKLKKLAVSVRKSILKVGKEDPRRVIHALKMGLALTMVSFLYFLEPMFKGIGRNAMWAVMTVVVVLEFTAGATLCKGLNRGFGTLSAGSLAFFIQFVAQKSGNVTRAIFVGTSVLLVGFAVTYVRFIPYIKKNYDYGFLIFLLTFNLISVSSYRITDVLTIARERLYTILIGCFICLLMSLMILPNWSGEELHNSTVKKLEGLATSIEACVTAYFQDKDHKGTEEESSEDIISKGYKAVLDSKTSDETLASFASWEPRHSRYRFPCQQYVKLGAVLRHFGYTAISLHGCLESEIQTPQSVRALFRDPCLRLAAEVSKVLMYLADSIRNRRHCSPNMLSDHLHVALQDLDTAFKSQPRLFLGSRNAYATTNMNKDLKLENDSTAGVLSSSMKLDVSLLSELRSKRVADLQQEPLEKKVLRPQLSKIAITSLEFSEALPFAAFASLLVETVARLDLVIEEVENLASEAHFKEFSTGDGISIEVRSDGKSKKRSAVDPGSNAVFQTE